MIAYALDPDAVLDFVFDWSAWLADTETITSHTVTPTAATGITIDSSSVASGVVTTWLSGAVAGAQRVTCHIVTNQGREDDRTITLIVRER